MANKGRKVFVCRLFVKGFRVDYANLKLQWAQKSEKH